MKEKTNRKQKKKRECEYCENEAEYIEEEFGELVCEECKSRAVFQYEMDNFTPI